jgi:hypothetical protein
MREGMSRLGTNLYKFGCACLLLPVVGSLSQNRPDADDYMTPLIRSIEASSVCAGSNGFTLTLSGEMFSSSSAVLWKGSARPTEYISSAQLRARIGSTHVASPGEVQVQIDNRTSLGRTSDARRFSIVSPCSGSGPLHVSTVNPRYFTDSTGSAIYLTGSHTWASFKNLGPAYAPRAFDFASYLDFLQQHGHNFIRLWTWELTKYDCRGEGVRFAAPFPWPRTGPGTALDGDARFDLSGLNQAYFDRLRARVMAAQARGIYVSVMLFEGYGLQFCQASLGGFPFLVANNVNGIDAPGTSSHTLQDPAVTAIQETYVRKVIDTLNDLDNVLYEIANESGPYSTDWQYHMIAYVKTYEATKPKQHPIGMTFQYQGGSNAALLASQADWISPTGDNYMSDPPPATGAKIILIDTDHLWGMGGDRAWVWKSFTRGMNPLYMDDLALQGNEDVRNAMGDAAAYAKKIDLLRMVPHGELASTHYCLANPGEEYLVYSPSGGSFMVDLRAAIPSEVFSVEWFNPGDRTVDSSSPVANSAKVFGGALRRFMAPFSGDSVLRLKRVQAVPAPTP